MANGLQRKRFETQATRLEEFFRSYHEKRTKKISGVTLVFTYIYGKQVENADGLASSGKGDDVLKR